MSNNSSISCSCGKSELVLNERMQVLLFFVPVTTGTRLCHGELLKAHKLCTHPAIASCLASAAGWCTLDRSNLNNFRETSMLFYLFAV